MNAPTSRRDLGAALLLVVLVVDLVVATRDWAVLPLGLLDWTGHLATAALALLAARRLGLALPARTVGLVLAGAVLIDLDHLPLYAGVPGVAAAGGRPFTHSLLTVALLAGLAAGSGRRGLYALAAGILLHFLRDAATGPGLALLWPSDVVTRAPYAGYAAVLAGLAAVAAVPAGGRQPQPAGSSPRRRR